jgi:RHS repeat-associated protein
VEYVRYSSYGEGVAYPAADVNMDGSVTTADQTAWNSGTPSGDYAFGGDSDLNRDNVVDAADTTFFNASYTANTATGGKGRVSSLSVSNRKGYAGYEFDEAASVYHVRHRVYLPESGRWSRRDPLGYVDGMGLYEYCNGSTIFSNDYTGLKGVCNTKENFSGDAFIVVCSSDKDENGSDCGCVTVAPGECPPSNGCDWDVYFDPVLEIWTKCNDAGICWRYIVKPREWPLRDWNATIKRMIVGACSSSCMSATTSGNCPSWRTCMMNCLQAYSILGSPITIPRCPWAPAVTTPAPGQV